MERLAKLRAWTRTGGTGTYTFSNANASSTNVTNLQAGIYTFRLTVTDNSRSDRSKDNVTVTVNAAPNQAPSSQCG